MFLWQINWLTLRLDNNKAFLCGFLSPTSAKRVVVRPIDLNWKTTVCFVFFLWWNAYSPHLLTLAYGKILLNLTSSCALCTYKASLGCRYSDKSPPFGHTQTFFFNHSQSLFQDDFFFFLNKSKNKKDGVETFSGPGKRGGTKRRQKVWLGYLRGISESLKLKLSFTASLARAFL